MDMNQNEATVLVKVVKIQTETPTESSPEISTEPVAATVSSETGQDRMLALLPKYATTPKRNAQRIKREPQKLLAYVLEQGPVVELTPDVYAALEQRGLPKHRIVNAVYKVKKYYGIPVSTARTGRKVTSYTFSL